MTNKKPIDLTGKKFEKILDTGTKTEILRTQDELKKGIDTFAESKTQKKRYGLDKGKKPRFSEIKLTAGKEDLKKIETKDLQKLVSSPKDANTIKKIKATANFDFGKFGPGVDISDIINKEKEKRKNISQTTLKEDLTKLKQKAKPIIDKAKNVASKAKNVVSKVPTGTLLKQAGKVGLGALGATGVGAAAVLGVGTVYEVGSMLKNLGKKAYTVHKAGQYKKEKKPTATFQKRSTKEQQIRDQKSERFIKYGNRPTGFLSDSYEFSKGGFSKVGMHDVMGSPISVDVDGDNLMNSSAQNYYKDIL